MNYLRPSFWVIHMANQNAEQAANQNQEATDVAGMGQVNTIVARTDTTATASWATHEARYPSTPTPTPALVSTLSNAIDLPAALNQQLVTVSFKSTGGASGDVITLTLQRLNAPADSDLIITLQPGLLLANSDPSQQNMVLLQPTNIELPPQQTNTQVSATAFCTQLHKANPVSGTSLALNGQGSPGLVSLMKAELSRNDNDSILVIQAAVWAITDNATRNDLIQVGYGLSDSDIDQVRQLLQQSGLNPGNYRLTS